MTDRRYPAPRDFDPIIVRLGLDPARILRRARLPPGLLGLSRPGVTADVFFRLWAALMAEADDPALPLRLGEMAADAEFLAPACRALIYSPDLATALDRLALFKQAAMPVWLQIRPGPSHLAVSIAPIDRLQLPPGFALTHFAWLLALIRRLLGDDAAALWTMLPDPPPTLPAAFGEVRRGAPMLALPLDLARRPIPSRDDAAWAWTEAELKRDLAMPLAARVRAVLRENLPAGEARAQAVAADLCLSPRTMQRQLAAEGTSYQALLDEVRAAMAQDYLARTDLSAAEIAYLLAYRDPSSFYRAFQGWTGTTPGRMRSAA